MFPTSFFERTTPAITLDNQQFSEEEKTNCHRFKTLFNIMTEKNYYCLKIVKT